MDRAITVMEPAIVGDFLCVRGKQIPPNAFIVFRSPAGETVIDAGIGLVRPSFVFVGQLPTECPRGDVTVSLRAGSETTDEVPVHVGTGPSETVRMLLPGASKPFPYTIAFVANRALPMPGSRTGVLPERLLSAPDAFHEAVFQALKGVVAVDPSLLEGIEDQMRVVSVHDVPTSPQPDDALVSESPAFDGDVVLDPERHRAMGFLATKGVVADVIFVVHGDSTNHPRAASRFGLGDRGRPFAAYRMDGREGRHPHFPLVAGAVALPSVAKAKTAFHEFAHAASDYAFGMIEDLYVDQTGVNTLINPVINKRFRDMPGGVVPAEYGSYAGRTFRSSPTRGPDLGAYPATWRSYHAQRRIPERANCMDDYQHDRQPEGCRLDALTWAWLRDRLRAKAGREGPP